MADDKDKTLGPEENPEPVSPDPLGILGWKIGGKYIIRTYIGGGGFGEVYEGFNANLPDQRLVFKFFKRVQQRSKFDKEARILCLLDHPNISRVIDYLPDEGAVVVAFIDGKDGRQILKETNAPLNEEDFMKVAVALTDAIAYAHEKNIAHRDLKPGNIMFDKNGHVYLIDFGIAKEIGDAATKTAYQALTPMFAAPERQEGEADYNPFLSDIFEAGVTLYNFATNDLPYRNPANPNYNEWGGQAATKFSSGLRQILMKATHPDPQQRYKTARELADAFKALKTAFGADEPVEVTEKKKAKWLTPMVIVILILASVGYFGRQKIVELWEGWQKADIEQTKEDEEAEGIKSAIDSILQKDTLTDTSAIIAAIDSSDTKTEESVDLKQVADTTLTKPTRDETTTKQVTTPETKPEEKKKVEPPAKVKLTVDVVPTGVSYISINRDSASVYDTFSLKPGTYTIRIYHREFPIYKENVTLSQKDKQVYIDLGEKFKTAGMANLQIALNPGSDQHYVDLSFNGKGHTLTEFPVFDFSKTQGFWQVDAYINSTDSQAGKPKIDSLVTFPYGGGKRSVVKRGKGVLDITVDKDGDANIPLLIYWSENN